VKADGDAGCTAQPALHPFSRLPFIFTLNFLKMKVKLIFSLILIAVATVWTACNDDDPEPSKGKYDTGVFVVNEGPFGGSGSITWYNPDTDETETDIFANNNNGALLGQFPQSITFHNDKAYIVVNSANRIVVVDANTFELVDTFGGFILPRFMLVTDDNTAWVTQWGQDGLDGSVVKIDLKLGSILKTIKLGNGPDKITQVGNRMYIPNSGGFGVDSTVSVVNLSTELEESRLTVIGKNPCCVATLFGDLWVLCKGSFSDPLPTGYVVNLNNGVFNSTFPYGDDLLAASDNTLRWAGGGFVWKNNGGQITGFINQQSYGLGYDKSNNHLYCADARDFSSNGQVVIYNLDGTKIDSFPVGVAPGEVVLK
jgi:DNA-binding beta-propeller fold protein YncE